MFKNMWIYLFASLFAGWTCMYKGTSHRKLATNLQPIAIVTILTNAATGLLISFVLKHLDNVVKVGSRDSACMHACMDAIVLRHPSTTSSRASPSRWRSCSLRSSRRSAAASP